MKVPPNSANPDSQSGLSVESARSQYEPDWPRDDYCTSAEPRTIQKSGTTATVKRTRQDWTQQKLAVGCIALACCAIPFGCTTDKISGTEKSHRIMSSLSTGMSLVSV